MMRNINNRDYKNLITVVAKSGRPNSKYVWAIKVCLDFVVESSPTCDRLRLDLVLLGLDVVEVTTVNVKG